MLKNMSPFPKILLSFVYVHIFVVVVILKSYDEKILIFYLILNSERDTFV